ncbi:hypothetical protein FRC10_008431 [Ceratobasidium sp. 414]|nr:hypothetical protein FRC10_008431 [Ceratobasidium sp. 414]
MDTSLAVPAAAVCALVLLVLHYLFIRASAPPPSACAAKALPSPTPSQVEKGETSSAPLSAPDQLVADVKAHIVEDVWPQHELPSPDDTPAPTLGSSLPDVALVWGVDYSFNAQPSMSALDRRPLMAYSHIATALGVDEPEPAPLTRSTSATVASMTPPTDTRPMRSRSLISGIVSDWNSLSQSEQQAWATLSEARASRTRSGNGTTVRRAHEHSRRFIYPTYFYAFRAGCGASRPHITQANVPCPLHLFLYTMVQIFRPATPGFLTTLAATAILAVVSFSVPYFKSVYFLKAAISQSGTNGSVTFGVMGYCLDFNNQITCSNATIGWEFNPNALLGNDLPIQIPNVVVKWLTYALVLHIVAFGLAGVSAIFGLLAHVREMSMSCFSSCISGMAAAVCLVAFIFDLVLFFAVRGRVNAIQGGSASIGNGLWLTLAAWVLLFFAGCMFSFGRCCVSKRPRVPKSQRDAEDDGGKYDRESERMRLDAVKAEADRKARQQAGTQEVGLPAFYEHERTPLRREDPQYYEEEVEVMAPYSDSTGPKRDGSRSTRATTTTGGDAVQYRPNRAYEPGAPGTRAIDDYYNGTAPVATEVVAAAAANTYPPQRHASQGQQAQGYEPQRYRSPAQDVYGLQNVTPAPVPQRYQSPSHDPYQQQYQQPATFADPYAQQPQQQRALDPYLAYADGGAHGHQAGGSSYYSATTHQQFPSAYPQQQQQPAHDPYANAASSYNPNAATISPPEVTHYQEYQPDYDQQQHGYDQQQQHGYGRYDPQQAYNAAAQQAYAQPEPVHYTGPAAGYDPYQQQNHDQVRQQSVPQTHEPYGQALSDEPSRMLVASPHPMDSVSPPYSPQPPVLGVNTSVAAVPPAPRGPRSAGAGPSQPSPQRWAGTEEGSSEAPPPQYDAVGPNGYPTEKR